MPKLILTRGIPGSGKSTWAQAYQAERLNCVRVNRDCLRWMVFNKPHSDDKKLEKLVKDIARSAVLEALSRGYDVVVDDTHCVARAILEWDYTVNVTNVGKDDDKRIQLLVVDFPISMAEAIRRDKQRDYPVGAGVIRDMVKLLQEQMHDFNYEVIRNLIVVSKHGAKIPFTWEV